ncbi:RecQ family ATP-dependent DNA helicase [Salsuginibacillus kocurii]|uniref:RecQ family ATP-dependent DNA helicase n=1 Tax=Salsuginibacillus kocurii TaxID=427078 RepID=UPI00035EA54B|nr:ATP-dependent DNA helicase RecQ [Salsuginibacillus kocurii]
MTLEEKLYNWFGYSSFRPGQKEIIEEIEKGKDVFAMLATGGGKSILYQLPAFTHASGLTLVVSPLISLMENQVQELKANGLKRVTSITSTLTFSEKQERMARLQEWRLLYVSPEMLNAPTFLERLKAQPIHLLVVDEAHCVSQWGHDFRPDYLDIGEKRLQLGSPPCLALTATATPTVREDILKHLHMDSKRTSLFCHSMNRPNIGLFVEHVQGEEDKKSRLLDIHSHFRGPMMIYTMSRMVAEELAVWLEEQTTVRVAAYHGGMEAQERLMIQQQFINGSLDVICCTSAFGMGINKPDVRCIIHYHIPADLESFVQEIGRAGRDGERAASIVLKAPYDEDRPEGMIYHTYPPVETIKHLLMMYVEDNQTAEQLLAAWDEEEELYGRQIVYALKRMGWFDSDDQLYTANIERMAAHLSKWVEERIANRLQKLAVMKKWLYATTCRREMLVKEFNETAGQNSECCDVCGAEWPEVAVKKDLKVSEKGWRDRLQQLLGE